MLRGDFHNISMYNQLGLVTNENECLSVLVSTVCSPVAVHYIVSTCASEMVNLQELFFCFKLNSAQICCTAEHAHITSSVTAVTHVSSN